MIRSIKNRKYWSENPYKTTRKPRSLVPFHLLIMPVICTSKFITNINRDRVSSVIINVQNLLLLHFPPLSSTLLSPSPIPSPLRHPTSSKDVAETYVGLVLPIKHARYWCVTHALYNLSGLLTSDSYAGYDGLCHIGTLADAGCIFCTTMLA